MALGWLTDFYGSLNTDIKKTIVGLTYDKILKTDQDKKKIKISG